MQAAGRWVRGFERSALCRRVPRRGGNTATRQFSQRRGGGGAARQPKRAALEKAAADMMSKIRALEAGPAMPLCVCGSTVAVEDEAAALYVTKVLSSELPPNALFRTSYHDPLHWTETTAAGTGDGFAKQTKQCYVGMHPMPLLQLPGSALPRHSALYKLGTLACSFTDMGRVGGAVSVYQRTSQKQFMRMLSMYEALIFPLNSLMVAEDNMAKSLGFALFKPLTNAAHQQSVKGAPVSNAMFTTSSREVARIVSVHNT
jgi:hypothetical protein